ncbi:uncharacterized protein [Vulpes vulpes]|uniref:Basic proline-rich protein-like n=1 Tax=Vulpes vulpes TaxID=9627 RepID=A0ABM4ZF87_VULVU
MSEMKTGDISWRSKPRPQPRGAGGRREQLQQAGGRSARRGTCWVRVPPREPQPTSRPPPGPGPAPPPDPGPKPRPLTPAPPPPRLQGGPPAAAESRTPGALAAAAGRAGSAATLTTCPEGGWPSSRGRPGAGAHLRDTRKRTDRRRHAPRGRNLAGAPEAERPLPIWRLRVRRTRGGGGAGADPEVGRRGRGRGSPARGPPASACAAVAGLGSRPRAVPRRPRRPLREPPAAPASRVPGRQRGLWSWAARLGPGAGAERPPSWGTSEAVRTPCLPPAPRPRPPPPARSGFQGVKAPEADPLPSQGPPPGGRPRPESGCTYDRRSDLLRLPAQRPRPSCPRGGRPAGPVLPANLQDPGDRND